MPESVFLLFRPFHGPEFDRLFARVMADPTGRRLLREGRSLHPCLLDFERLRSLPEDTLGGAYLRFMQRNEVDIVSFEEASLRHMAREDYRSEEAWNLANRLRDVHELVHLVSGYETDRLGEMCELAFNIREDPRPRASRFAIRSNLQVFRNQGYGDAAEGAIAEAYDRARRVGLLVAQDWEARMDRPLEEIRAQLGISEHRHYEPIFEPPGAELPDPGGKYGLLAMMQRDPVSFGPPPEALSGSVV